MATLSSCVCCFELITKDMVCLKKCGHVFHGDCVREWIKSTSSCPTCRVKNRSSDILKLYVTAGEAASQSDSQVDGGGDFPGDNKVKVGDLFKKVKDAKKATAKKVGRLALVPSHASVSGFKQATAPKKKSCQPFIAWVSACFDRFCFVIHACCA